jgi:hypothetical protein
MIVVIHFLFPQRKQAPRRAAVEVSAVARVALNEWRLAE